MHVVQSQLHADGGLERLPAFSLATALAWIGHECRTCPPQVDSRAHAWLRSPPAEGRPSGMRALIDVEFLHPSWSAARGVDLMYEINMCTCRDRIQVTQVFSTDQVTTHAARTTATQPATTDVGP